MRIGKGIGAAVLSALLCTAMLFLPTTAFAENLNATDQIGMVRSNVPYLQVEIPPSASKEFHDRDGSKTAHSGNR